VSGGFVFIREGDVEGVVVVQEDRFVQVATPGIQGPPGPKGDPGTGGFTYVHDQGVPATIWTIFHGLGGYPNVTVVDSSGREVIGEVEYIDGSVLKVKFAAAFSGKAFLS
jgi:hypothetical protein